MIPTGLLGGSFNPAHAAHRKISLFALEALTLDEVWWLVSPGNPLKEGAGARHALHGRYARQACPAISRTPLHLADGCGQSRPVPPLARLAENRAHRADCGDRKTGI
jgi:nicotinic acid mononucleotide adenylyltransferase